jgi:exodeoxyribonuclease VIII
MNTDIMIDLETLATTPDAAVLSIGAVRFDPYGNDIKSKRSDPFYCRIDIDSCDRLGLRTDDSTIEWWSRQSKEAQDEAFNPEGRIDIKDAVNDLYQFCWGAKRVWSHGAGFDIIILETIFRRLEKTTPWRYYEVRDTRTLFDLGVAPNRPPILKHHALEDAWNQAVGVQNVLRKLQEFDLKVLEKI